MTLINLSTLMDALGGPVPVDAVLTFTATRSRASGAVVVANGTVTVRIVAGVPTEPVDLVPSGVDWAYKATLSVSSIGRRIDRTVAVPDVPSVEWADLVDVDPATLLPAESAVPAWTAAVGQVAAALADTETARDGAVTAQGLSEAARDAAVLARGISEIARDGAVVAQGASEEARDQAQVYAANTLELQDTTFTALIANPESATRAQLNATFVAIRTVDLETFLLPGEALPSYEVSVSLVAALSRLDAPVQMADGGKYGPNYARLIVNQVGSASARIGRVSGALPGTRTVSAWVRTTKGAVIRPFVVGYWASNASQRTYQKGGIRATGDWQRVSLTVTLPANGSRIDINVALDGAVVGQHLDVDGTMQTVGTALWPYIDGNQPNCAWSGTVGSSSSILTIPA